MRGSGGDFTDSSTQDIITGDELISDSYDLKEVDGAVYEADCSKITVGGESFDTGANPSAEDGGDEGGGESKETKIDVVHSFRMNETSFDKKSYLSHLKGVSATHCLSGSRRLADARMQAT